MASNVYQMPPPPMGRAGTTFPTTSGTWAWNGGTQQWTVLPSGTSQVYGWDGTTQTWVPVTGGGGTGMGVTDGSVAAPGQIGELVAVLGTQHIPVPLSSGTITYVNLVTTSLTAGDWDISGWVQWVPAAAGSTAPYVVGGALYSTTSASNAGLLPETTSYLPMQANSENASMPIATQNLNITAITPLYLLGYILSPIPGDTSLIAQAWGRLYARRMR